MKKLQPYDTYVETVEGYYSALSAPADGPWYPGILKLMVFLTELGHQNSERFAAMAANVLSVIPAHHREKFLSDYSIPSSILSQLDSPPPWPEQKEMSTFLDDAGAWGEDRARRLPEEVAAFIASQTLRAIPGGAYSAMAYAQKQREAEAYLDVLDTGEDPRIEAFPHLAMESATYAGGAAELAERVLDKAQAWSVTSARLGSILQTVQAAVQAGIHYDESLDLLRTAKAEVRQVIDDFLLGKNTPKPSADPDDASMPPDAISVTEH